MLIMISSHPTGFPCATPAHSPSHPRDILPLNPPSPPPPTSHPSKKHMAILVAGRWYVPYTRTTEPQYSILDGAVHS